MGVFNRILEFLGANIMDEKPFMVMPYLMNGNARDYLLEHPSTERLPIVRMSNICVIVWRDCNIAPAVTSYFSRTRLSPLQSYCAWGFESRTLL